VKHPLYCIWHNIRERCFNSNNNRYKNYGGRGITICDTWSDYKTFEQWCLANGWQHGLTIDRIDNDGNYESGNCQVMTRIENCRKGTSKSTNQFNLIGNFITNYPSVSEASRQTKIHISSICDVCNGKRKTAGGYRWKYA